MILRQLTLRNYKQYTSLDLTFEEGLVGIIGRNGAGKSTLFEAILYCLFGKETQPGAKNFARSTYADPAAAVELKLSFLIGQTEYEVHRSFRGKALTAYADLYRNGQLTATGVSVVNQETVRILGLDAEAFRRSVFSGQKELSELSGASGEDRKKLVRRMMGFDMLDQAQQSLRADVNALKYQIEGQSSTLLSETELAQMTEELFRQKSLTEERRAAEEVVNQQLQEIRAESDVISAEFNMLQALYDNFNELEKQKAGQEARKTELAASLDALRKHLARLEERKVRNALKKPEFERFQSEKQRLTVMEAEKDRFTNYNMALQKIEAASTNISAAEVKINEMNEAIKAADSVKAALARVGDQIGESELQLRACSENILPLQKEMAGTEGLIRDRRERLKSLTALGAGSQCPTCLQPLLDNYARAVSELEMELSRLQEGEQVRRKSRIDELIAEQKILAERINVARKEEAGLNAELSRLRETWRQLKREEEYVSQQRNIILAEQEILSKIGEVHYDKAAYDTLRTWVSANEQESVAYQSEDTYLQNELPKTSEQISQAINSISIAEENIRRLAQEAADLQFDSNRYQSVSKDRDEYNRRYSVLSEQKAALGREAMVAQAAADNLTGSLDNNERIRQKIAERSEELELLRKLDRHLTDFRTEILEKVSPAISRVAGELFNRITQGKYEGIEVNDAFEFSISDNGKMYPISRFSGGEIDLANFCLRIAITRAIIELSGAGHRLEFLAFDEIFGSQDEDRRMEIMHALALLKEQFPQIYIVSHIESLRDYFPHLLEVQSSSTGSTAVWR